MELGDITVFQYLIVAAVAFFAGILGGVAGYGSGALTLMVLVPILGPQTAVPVVSFAGLLTNTARLWVFRKECDLRKTIIISAFALPTTALGAWGFTRLTSDAAMILIGAVLIVLVPLRIWLNRLAWRLDDRRLAVASVGYGLVSGGTSGAGVLLLSMLMWAGVGGAAVIATDAAVTLALISVKTATFHASGILPLSSVLMAVLLGAAGTPGAFVAKRLASRLSLKQHTAILDAVVVFAGLQMIYQGLH